MRTIVGLPPPGHLCWLRSAQVAGGPGTREVDEVDGQERLFRLAVEALNVSAVHEWNRGWRVTIGARRQDEEWSDAGRRTYTYLTTEELFDVIVAELERIFGR